MNSLFSTYLAAPLVLILFLTMKRAPEFTMENRQFLTGFMLVGGVVIIAYVVVSMAQ